MTRHQSSKLTSVIKTTVCSTSQDISTTFFNNNKKNACVAVLSFTFSTSE